MALIAQHWIDGTASGDPNAESIDPATDEAVGHNKLFAEAEMAGSRQRGIGRIHGYDALADFTGLKHIHQAPSVV
ncbi:MAG: hypothetical protein ACTHJ3_02330 [Pararhizobium sp.]